MEMDTQYYIHRKQSPKMHMSYGKDIIFAICTDNTNKTIVNEILFCIY